MESVVAVTPEKCIMIDAAAEEWEELDMAVDNVEGEACRKEIKYEVASSTPISSRSLRSQAEGASASSCADLLGIQAEDEVSSLPAYHGDMEDCDTRSDAAAGWNLCWLRTRFQTFPTRSKRTEHSE